MRAALVGVVGWFALACTRDGEITPLQVRAPQRGALDSAAVFRAPITAELYHQLRGWRFSAPDSAPLALGPRAITALSNTGARALVDSATEGQVLSFAPSGSHVGRMQLEGELVTRFELRTAAGQTLWTHEGRGHHYYSIGPDGRLIVGHSSSTAHPGKPGSVGTLTFYDLRGGTAGQFSCSTLGGSEIAPDAEAALVECRDSALVLLDPRGRVLSALAGSYRNFRLAAGGRVVAAVPVGQPRSLTLLTATTDAVAGQTRSIQFREPVRQVAVSTEGGLVVATVGAEVVGVNPGTGAEAWRVKLEGEAPLISSLSLGPNGLVAVGAVLNGARALDGRPGPHPAVVTLIENGRVLRSLRFELDSLNAWVPSVALSPDGRGLLLWDQTGVWSIDLPRWLNR